MNELDKQIAEYKGLMAGARALGFDGISGPLWSTSDAKALELVDELAADRPDQLGRWYFRLMEEYISPGLNHPAWAATFYYGLPGGQIQHHCPDRGRTRPEAICRAYLAAREWMDSARPTDPELRAKMRTMREGFPGG